MHIIFAGGGTGGHLFPGLAVAAELSRLAPGVRISFVGAGKPFERQHVESAGYGYFALACRPLPRRASEAVSFLVENLAGYLAAVRLIQDEKVSAVVGLGGYASVPMGRAARRRRLPLVLLEQNLVPGRATRWLARKASLVCTSFAETEARLRARCPVRVTGNPIRTTKLMAGLSADTYAQRPRRLLVLGGSGGARALNENVPRALYKLGTALAGWTILHQSGKADLETTRTLYGKLGVTAEVVPFVDSLPDRLPEMALAVCRAGGTTLAELAAAGVPAILVPYPHATDDHQRLNAEYYVKAGGALLFDQQETAGRLDDRLASELAVMIGDPQRLAAMAAMMHRTARPEAAADVARLLWSVVTSQAQEVQRAAP